MHSRRDGHGATPEDLPPPVEAPPAVAPDDVPAPKDTPVETLVRVEGKLKDVSLSGYFESDFLSAGATSNNNQSNSYVLRQRQIWGKAETKGGFAVTGGQTWSMVTEDARCGPWSDRADGW